jgi:hypothetical protein
MTFLEYLCERLIGPPAKPGGREGETYWLCPFHDDSNPSFHTLPHKPEYKDRWLCFGCGNRGDEADLVKAFYPGEDWPRRRLRLDQWRQEFEARAEREQDAPPETTGPTCFSLRGSGKESTKGENPYGREPSEDEFSPEADAALGELMDFLRRSSPAVLRVRLLLAQKALAICAKYRLHPLGFAGRCGAEVWFRDMEAQHLAECKDPECDVAVCRAARGLPPLTREEIEASKLKRVEERQQQLDRKRMK